MTTFLKYLKVFAISMVPILELRAAVPLGVTVEGLPLLPVLGVSVLGNMLPVPFIILFIRPIFNWMKERGKLFRRIAEKMEQKAERKADKIKRYELFGLFLLVAIPLPGTGAWTGALVAALFDIRLKNAVPVILAGVVTAGVVMSLITFGAKAFLT
ncbi:MAG: small multi-drug export protein [Clostridia bacterium]|nr:small multi-drug export protein [Clostridia bacterium]